MSEKEKEFYVFMGFCEGEKQKGKTVDEIWQAWKDREKRVKRLSELLDKLTTRELALLNAVLEATAGTEPG